MTPEAPVTPRVFVRPVPMAAFMAVPTDLKRLDRWVCWKAEARGGKLTKIPVDPKTGQNASATDPVTWASFLVALKARRTCGGGIGFVLGAGIVGVDLDHCRDAETGVIEPWAVEIIRKLNGYTELSPSGTGVHVIVRGKLPEGRRRKGNVEMYDSGRFFTVTGRALYDV